MWGKSKREKREVEKRRFDEGKEEQLPNQQSANGSNKQRHCLFMGKRAINITHILLGVYSVENLAINIQDRDPAFTEEEEAFD